MTKRAQLWLAVAVAVIAVAVVVMFVRREPKPAAPAAPATATGSASAKAPDRAASPHIRRLDPQQRAQIAEAIERAHARRAAGDSADRSGPPPAGTAAPTAPIAPPSEELDLEHTPIALQDAMKEAIPILADCFAPPPGSDAGHHAAIPRVGMTMRGDPDVGTLVDTNNLVDENGQPLPAREDQCVRAALASIEFPPLKDNQYVSIEYSFRFDD